MNETALKIILFTTTLIVTSAAVMTGFMLLGLCEISWESYLGSILLVAGFRFTINLKYQ